ncbi:MAG: nucleotidyltransferase [Thermoanaerobaculia bacterium]|nr:nucleotidyltransferase [Thermoanaerobaculia bacterium]
MKPKKLILTSFRRALASLEAVLQKTEVDDIIRDATIQRFEYTYEIAWKMIDRHLTWMGAADVKQLSRKDLFREAAKAGLIEDPEAWFDYNRARNETSHTYSEQTAIEVFEAAKQFAPAARKLLIVLEQTHG